MLDSRRCPTGSASQSRRAACSPRIYPPPVSTPHPSLQQLKHLHVIRTAIAPSENLRGLLQKDFSHAQPTMSTATLQRPTTAIKNADENDCKMSNKTGKKKSAQRRRKHYALAAVR